MFQNPGLSAGGSTSGLATEQTALAIAGLVTDPYDYVSVGNFTANDDPQTIIYKTGGAGGTTVATLTLVYDGSNRLTSVTKT